MEKKAAFTVSALVGGLLIGAPGTASAAADAPCVVRLVVPDIRVDRPRVTVTTAEHATCHRYVISSDWRLTLPDARTRHLLFRFFIQRDSLTLYDTDAFGTWHATGIGSSDATGTVMVQPPMSFVVKRASGVTLTTSRAGARVTTSGVARAYRPASNRFAAWPAATVRLQSRPAAGGTWVTLSTYRTDSAGRIPTHRWQAPRPRQFRMIAHHTPEIWAAYGTPQRR